LATFAPHTASSAGEIVSAQTAATSATVAPAMPIDFRKPSGNTTSVASAHATVTAEKQTVDPARPIVVRSASCSDAPPASSWR
jgi:phage tail sheath gpL-like